MVRIFVSSRRPCDSDALATSSYGTNFAHPLSAATFVSAAVSVVLPWSMCPIVPTLTCGFERSNFSLAISRSAQNPKSHCPNPNFVWDLGFGVWDLFGPLYPGDYFFTDVLRRLLVAIEMHRVGGATLGARPQVGRVAEHLRQRHPCVDDLRAAAVFLRLDASTPAGEVAHHVAHVVLRDDDLDPHHRFEQHRLRLLGGVLERHRAGDLERHFR